MPVKMRMPHEIVEQLLAVAGLPDEMRARLASAAKSMGYVAPEQMAGMLHLVQGIFNAYVSKPPAEPWQWQAAAAFMNMTEDELRAKFVLGEKV